MRKRRVVMVGVLLLAIFALPMVASAQSSDDPDGRARPSFVEGIVDADGQLWLKIGFYDVWGDEPPRDIFSLFWFMGIITDDATSSVGWETHDGVETYLGDDGTEAYILDNGCVLISTGLYPTDEYEVSIVAEFASWLVETDPVFSGSDSFGTSSQFIEAGNPFVDFGGSPVWDLTTGQTFTAATTTTTTTTTTATTTTSTTTTTTTATTATTATTLAASTTDDSSLDSATGFPWWLLGLAALAAFLLWMYFNGAFTRTPGQDDADDDPPPDRSGPESFTAEDRAMLQQIYEGAAAAGHKIAGISSIKNIEKVERDGTDGPVIIGRAVTLYVRVAADGSLIPRRGDTDQGATSILEIDVRPRVESDSGDAPHVVWDAYVKQVDVATGKFGEISRSGPSTEEWDSKVDGRSDAEIGNDPSFRDWVIESLPSTPAEAVEQALGGWSPAGP